MNRIYACIDGQSNTLSVIDWSAWAAQRLDAPLEFLHVLERHPERARTKDFSGAIGLGAQESLLRDLSASDAQQSKAAVEAGRRLLASARERATAAGVTQLDGRLRHGEFVATAQELEAGARLLVKAGFEANTQLIAGEHDVVLPEFVKSQGAQLLVMRVFGHWWHRQLIKGSTTSTLLRVSDVPVLILR